MELTFASHNGKGNVFGNERLSRRNNLNSSQATLSRRGPSFGRISPCDKSLDSMGKGPLGSLLQSRPLAGNIPNKGRPWKSNPRPQITDTAETGSCESPTLQFTQANTKKKVKVSIPKDRKKVCIVTCKKTLYGNLVSDHKIMPKHETSGPIVYSKSKKDSSIRKEVAPLWFHQFTPS